MPRLRFANRACVIYFAYNLPSIEPDDLLTPAGRYVTVSYTIRAGSRSLALILAVRADGSCTILVLRIGKE